MENVFKVVKENNQEHLLNVYDKLAGEQKETFFNQISSINYEYMNSLFEAKDHIEMMEKKLTSVNVTDSQKIDKKRYEPIGDNLIKSGKLAICSMAGGQGTRLGFNGPKGTYMLDLEKPISIFETIVNRLKEAHNKYDMLIYWYIMTSRQNNAETIKFFEDNNYFGYSKEHIIFFEQGELPLLDKNGKMVLNEEGNIFMAPDGNGGIFKALDEKGILNHMKEHGVEYLTVGNVDNILIHMIDPIALGVMKDNNSDLLAKSFMKPYPEGRWGVFCKMDGKLGVIEYSETPEELLNARNEEGELTFGDAHYGCNFFSRNLLERFASEKLPMHTAIKKNKVLCEDGNLKEIETYKFEAFIFDAFAKAENEMIYRIVKDEEFAPIKNKEGAESPETAIKLYKEFYNMK